ncbi:MAG: pyridoxal phosphate-dependent decarboxylase family protein [Aggregatilineales bacterium]
MTSIDLTPEAFRELGYRAVDLLVEQLQTVPTAPVRQPMTDEARERLMSQPLPEAAGDPAALLDAVADQVLPYPMGNISPRFFGWVNSPAAPLGILADLLAAGLNSSVAGGDHAATYVEHAVLRWLKTMVNYPQTSGALLVSGGSMANLTGLAVMRYCKAQGPMRAQGFYGESAPMVIYTSTQGHSCIEKAVEALGFGHDYLRKIPVDADFRMDVAQLRAQIEADRAAGLRPVCVAASAGTVNTGAIDPLNTIANVCAEYDLWFHIDGAYGGLGILAEQTKGLYDGMERGDSLAIDPHKWLYVPVECGCAFIRDAQAMRDTFSLVPPYLRDDKVLPWFSEFGLQQTRGFRALKLWLVIQQTGVQGYRDSITHDIELAHALQAKIKARSDFELIAAGPLSVTCFRYCPTGVTDPAALSTLNKKLLETVQREGIVFLTSTELHGQTVLRACIVNFRTTPADLDTLLDVIAEVGARMTGI